MKIALGVTGGIAAYKAADIARRLQERGLRVQVVMTESAQEFVRPLTFAALTGEKMGYAMAEAALRRGARVMLVSGPTALPAPAVEEFVAVESSAQMREALLERFGRASVTIMTAAVSDFAPAEVAAHKIKREGGISSSADAGLRLELRPTADILAELGSRRAPGQLLVGFAAETGNLRDNARQKLERKKVDAIVLNDVSRPGLGFGSERNAGEIITAGEITPIEEMSKAEMADMVLDAVVKLRAGMQNKQRNPKVTA